MKRPVRLPKIRALDLRPPAAPYNWDWPTPPSFTDEDLSQVRDQIALARFTRDVRRMTG